jgi:hypothetical protein
MENLQPEPLWLNCKAIILYKDVFKTGFSFEAKHNTPAWVS